MTDNLRIWNRFCRTEASATKNFNKGGFAGTDINPTYRVRCLTELFGPQGTGWGWTIQSRWREVWPSRYKDGGQWIDYDANCAFVELSLWYLDEQGQRHECSPQIGGTECDLAPDEVWKMSITDAIGKCCVALGIAADVYMGQFDGKYHSAAERQQTQPPPIDRSQPVAEKRLGETAPAENPNVLMEYIEGATNTAQLENALARIKQIDNLVVKKKHTKALWDTWLLKFGNTVEGLDGLLQIITNDKVSLQKTRDEYTAAIASRLVKVKAAAAAEQEDQLFGGEAA